MSLAAIQIDCAHRLEADAYFVDITVLHERMGNLDDLMTKALGTLTKKDGKFGIFVVVANLKAFVNKPDAALHFDDCQLNCFVFENVPFNNLAGKGTGKAALDVAVRICQLLHHYYPAGLAQTLYCDRDAITPDKPPAKGAIAYRVPIRVPADVDTEAKVVTPTIAPAIGAHPQTVTLSCGTSGAAIYYTTDESYPAAGNTQATLYTIPFSVAAACALRVVAFKTNMIASDSALAVFT